jgi:hypothetical protein
VVKLEQGIVAERADRQESEDRIIKLINATMIKIRDGIE